MHNASLDYYSVVLPTDSCAVEALPSRGNEIASSLVFPFPDTLLTCWSLMVVFVSFTGYSVYNH
jgi:hypothetical protein